MAKTLVQTNAGLYKVSTVIPCGIANLHRKSRNGGIRTSGYSPEANWNFYHRTWSTNFSLSNFSISSYF